MLQLGRYHTRKASPGSVDGTIRHRVPSGSLLSARMLMGFMLFLGSWVGITLVGGVHVAEGVAGGLGSGSMVCSSLVSVSSCRGGVAL